MIPSFILSSPFPMPTATADEKLEKANRNAVNAGPLSVGRHFGLVAKLWQKQSKDKKTYFTIELEKSYKDGETFKDYSVSVLLKEWPVIREMGDQMYREGLDYEYENAKENRE